jgi:hypothetical protein
VHYLTFRERLVRRRWLTWNRKVTFSSLVSELGSDNQPSIPASPNSPTYELDTLHNRMTELRNEIFRNCETYLAASTKSHTRRLDDLSERMAELHDTTIEKYDHYALALT